METIKDTYYIKVKPEFLFDIYGAFQSSFTTWVYLSLKFKYKYYLEKAPNKTFRIDVKTMADCYVTTTSTIYEALSELVCAGLLERVGRKYRIREETIYMNRYKNEETNEHKNFPDFLLIYNNAFYKLLLDIKRQILPMGNFKRLIVKALKLYYYLIACNRHCLLKEEAVVESRESQTSLSKELRHDHKVVKFLLSVLQDAGYIKLEPETKILTLNKELYTGKEEYTNKTYEDYYENKTQRSGHSKFEPVKQAPDKIKTVPDSFIGYFKSTDGNTINIIYYNKKYQTVMLAYWCKGDGIPRTYEETEIKNNLINYGKKSIYFDSNNYWLYEKDKGTLDKAA